MDGSKGTARGWSSRSKCVVDKWKVDDEVDVLIKNLCRPTQLFCRSLSAVSIVDAVYDSN